MGTASITEWDLDRNRAVQDNSAVSLTVDFDPQSLELSYATRGTEPGGESDPAGTWNKTAAQQTGQSATLSVTLLFDTSTTDGVSVQTRTEPLVRLTMPHDLDVTGPRRRVVRFHWGLFLFYGCVDSMTQTIDFFSDAGVPLRASVHLTMRQVLPPNPSAGSGESGPSQSFGANAGIGASASFSASASAGASFSASASAGIGTTPLTLSQHGDTIQAITARAGGSASWKAVATANNIDNPRLLPPGTVLSVNADAQFSAGLG